MSFLRISMIWAITIFLISISFEISSGDNLIQTGTYGSGDDFAGGSGTLSDPYRISNISDLQKMNSNLSAHYVIVNDIDASETYYWNNGSGFDPIGNLSGWFNGSLDGRGYHITDLLINRSSEDFIGLFGCVNDKTLLTNISIIDCNISGRDIVGGLAGYNEGEIRDCFLSGIVTGDKDVGGMVGYSYEGFFINCSSSADVVNNYDTAGGLIGSNDGNVFDCYSTGNVSGYYYVGGLIGSNDGNVVLSYSVGNVTGFQVVGGLIGENIGTVAHCSAICNVTGNNTSNGYIGGLIGITENIVNNCSVEGRVSGDHDVGGLVGCNTDTVTDCSSNVSVFGISIVGGLIGFNDGEVVSNCSSTGNVEGYHSVGGLVGVSSGKLTYCVSDVTVMGYEYIGGLAGSFFRCLLYDSSYSGDVFGEFFVGGFVGYCMDSRIFNSNSSGFVKGNSYVGGLVGSVYDGGVINCSTNVTVDGKYDFIGGLVGENVGSGVISSFSTGDVFGSRKVGGLIGHNNQSLVSDCYSSSMVGGDRFIGGLVGNNYNSQIFNSYSTGPMGGNSSVGGLVGYNFESTISDCHTNGSVNGTDLNIGGLVGENSYGEVSSSFSTGSVSGLYHVGGLIGNNNNNSQVSDCYSLSMVRGDRFIGGLIGYNHFGKVFNSYSTGFVKGGFNIGGLVGYSNIEWYIVSSFWDNRTSGLNLSEGGTGKNTSDMMNKSTFTTTGWDFINIWRIIDGYSYPYLREINYGIPRITTGDVETAYEGSLYYSEYNATSNIPGGREVIWNLTTNTGDWLSITKNGVLSGIPMNEDVGFYWVNISATIDDIRFDYSNFTLTVLNTNNDPVINTTSLPDALEDKLYNFWIDGTDIDPTNDIITWWMETNSSFLNINPYSGILSGIPDNDDVGTWSVRVSLFDGNGGYDNTSLSLTVINVNDDPQILPYELIDIFSDVPFFIDLDAVDIDPTEDTMEWSQRSNCGFASIDPGTGNLSGIVPEGEFGEWWFNVTVVDGKGGSDLVNFSLSIIKENHRPILNMTELTLYTDEDSDGITLDLAEIFFDPDGDELTYDIKPFYGLTFWIQEGVATIIPGWNVCGQGILWITATDGEFSVGLNVTLIINPTNDAPFGASIIAEPSYFVGMDQIVEARAFDYDIPYGDELTFRWESNISGEIGTGKSINLSLKVGIHLVTLTVTDSEGSSTTAVKEIQILPEEVEDDPVDDHRDEDFPFLLLLIPFMVIVVLIIVLFVFFWRRSSTDQWEE